MIVWLYVQALLPTKHQRERVYETAIFDICAVSGHCLRAFMLRKICCNLYTYTCTRILNLYIYVDRTDALTYAILD